ncbi:AMP-binding protein [Streptomyces sp. SAS_281]|uniref:AMP-binding protein n=1 Tax=Streptomyces sp. SAS_281 TaxID=3412744 RepID=UPI00403D05F6
MALHAQNELTGRAADLAYPQGTLVHTLLDDAVAEAADACAVRDFVAELSYRRLNELSHAVAHWLRGQGVGPGDRVVVQLPSRVELVALFYGVARSGAVFVPLNPAMKRYHLASVLDNAEPALVIGDAASAPGLRESTAVAVHELSVVWPHIEALATREPEAVTVDVQPEDIAALVYTSGSTAAPKAVICPHRQATFASSAINAELRYRPDDVVFCRFPLSWDYGLYKVLLSCLGRSELVLAGEESDLLLLRRMRETGATIVPIVPSLAAMIATLTARDSEPAPPVRMFTNTGAALPAPTIAALREAFPGVRVVRQFGQTECKRISIMPPEEDQERPQSVGRPLPGTSVLILGPDGEELPLGETGEIVAAGPHVMPGYWRAAEQTATAFRRDPATGGLRLHTGDYGSLDADGYLYFEGRRDDMFKRKGIRMSTVEIEAAAMDVTGVRVAAVLPPTDGRDLTIFVESDLAPTVVLKELARRLEPAKVPALCRVIPELPLTLHGKNARQALIDMLEGDDT